MAIHIITSLTEKNDRLLLMNEIERLASNDVHIIIAGSNRRSKHFAKSHSDKQRMSFTHYSEIVEIMQKKFNIEIFGYGSFSNKIMSLFKKILYNIPEKISEELGMEGLFFKILRSNTLEECRSYIMFCKRK